MNKKILRHIGLTLVAASAFVVIHTDAQTAVLCASPHWSTNCGSIRNPHDSDARVWGVRCYKKSETCKEGEKIELNTLSHSHLRNNIDSICSNCALD